MDNKIERIVYPIDNLDDMILIVMV